MLGIHLCDNGIKDDAILQNNLLRIFGFDEDSTKLSKRHLYNKKIIDPITLSKIASHQCDIINQE